MTSLQVDINRFFPPNGGPFLLKKNFLITKLYLTKRGYTKRLENTINWEVQELFSAVLLATLAS